ncbi:sigma-E processing peptidase SpoIIGA [Tuberibacillus sp. Marseille-P3662]|uniref:sigma-E processing peptidase SpoIIGA n=1 Tax=Tuberibacillus sp. Marseille-P3662 TaxID=1965358 RepID=UPI000A1C9169|nr:sigma-E processing peptidase SpoIIGA [Tuberibacillus sp. Marseille-P3662]
MTVYLDVVWLLNVLIDFMILQLTALILKRSVAVWRLVIGTLFASLIILLLFTPLSPLFYHPVGKSVYSAIIVFIVFGYRRFGLFVQSFFMFYFVTFAIGGGLYGLRFFLFSNQSYANWLHFSTYSFGDPFSWLFIICGFPILWWFSKKRMDHAVIRKFDQSQLADVEITVNDVTLTAKGMIDTGNRLYHPVHQTPVMFVSHEACGDSLPESFFQTSPLEIMEHTELAKTWGKYLTIVPYRGVDGGQNFVLALKPERVMIDMDGRHLKVKKVLVGLSGHDLAGDHEFNCILHPDLLQTGKNVGTAS